MKFAPKRSAPKWKATKWAVPKKGHSKTGRAKKMCFPFLFGQFLVDFLLTN